MRNVITDHLFHSLKSKASNYTETISNNSNNKQDYPKIKEVFSLVQCAQWLLQTTSPLTTSHYSEKLQVQINKLGQLLPFYQNSQSMKKVTRNIILPQCPGCKVQQVLGDVLGSVILVYNFTEHRNFSGSHIWNSKKNTYYSGNNKCYRKNMRGNRIGGRGCSFTRKKREVSW